MNATETNIWKKIELTLFFSYDNITNLSSPIANAVASL